MENSRVPFVQTLQTLSEEIRSRPLSASQAAALNTHLEKDGLSEQQILSNIATTLAQANVQRLDELQITSQAFVPLYALQLASVLADSPLIESSSKDIFMSQIHAITSSWLSSIFGLWSTKSVTFIRSEFESLRQVFQMALEKKYHGLHSEGFAAMYSRPPTVYVPDHSQYTFLVEAICSSLFIPKSNIRFVPLEHGSTRMSVSEMQQMVENDVSDGKIPTLVVARAGTHLTGEYDDLVAIRALCDTHGIWMHCEGNGLALLSVNPVPASLAPAANSDTITVSIGRWFGLHAFPSITFYRNTTFGQVPRTHFPEVFLCWVYIQSTGQGYFSEHFSRAIETFHLVVSKLKEVKYINVLPRSLDSQSALFHFQLDPSMKGAEASHEFLKLENIATQYLSDVLKTSLQHKVDTVLFEGRVLLRFQMLNSRAAPKREEMEELIAAIEQETVLMVTTLQCREAFKRAAEEERDIKFVEPEEGWFGLGGIRCIPSYLRDEESVSSEVQRDISELNEMVLIKLSEQDAHLFRRGTVPGTDWTCILIGVHRSPLTTENASELVKIISHIANELEKSERFIGGLAAVIKRGISEAEDDLQRENDQKLVEEGFLKHIPLFGSIFSMFNAAEEPKKGGVRSFNISKGKLDRVPAPVKTPPIQAYAKERKIAIGAVEYACKVCEKVFASLVTSDTLIKNDKSPVTVADFASQAIINLALRDAFPADPVVGEEDVGDLKLPGQEDLKNKVISLTNDTLGTNFDEQTILSAIGHSQHPGGRQGRFWTLDPIDGTKGFLRKGQYAVCLALIVNGEVVLGVLGCPNLPVSIQASQPSSPTAASPSEKVERGSIFVAVKGQGSFQRSLKGGPEIRLHVSKATNPAEATFCESVEAGHSSQDEAAAIASKLGITNPPIRMDSQCKYAAIARGDASIYLRLPVRADYQEKIWDHASGYLLVKEAGGEVRDAQGKDLDFGLGRTLSDNSGLVASNRTLFPTVLDTVRQVLSQASAPQPSESPEAAPAAPQEEQAAAEGIQSLSIQTAEESVPQAAPSPYTERPPAQN